MTTTGEQLLLVGVSHKEAPLDLRERLHVGAHEAGDVGVELACAGGAVVVSTCNRTEIYVADIDARAARTRVVGALAERAGVAAAELGPVLNVAAGSLAARHLFRVAAGLESRVVGEPQILGQVREARRLAAAAGSTGRLLDRLFDHALLAGKRVRTETTLATASDSIAAAAAQLVKQRVGPLEGRRVLIVGTGKIGGLTAAGLVAPGVESVFVAHRGLERAVALADRFGGRAVGLDRLGAEVERADVVVSCTRCPQLVLELDEVARALARRHGAPLLLVDLAVPRDIDPRIGDLPGCELHDVDAVGSCAARTTRAGELRRAEQIVADEVARFEAWQRALGVAPDIASLRRRAESIRVSELARADAKLAALTPAERRAVEALTAQLVNKLLHLPTVRAKEAPDALRHLFALEDVA